MRLRLWCTLDCLSVFTAVFLGARWSSADQPPVHDFEGYQNGVYGDPPHQKFRTSNITAPVFNYGAWNDYSKSPVENMHLLLTLNYDGAGPYIFSDEDLSLVYADPSFVYATNARVQTIHGNDYLSFWHGARNRGDSQGYCVFYDQHYRLVYNVTLAPPFPVDADLHECEVTPNGTVLLTAYYDKKFDLTPVGGKVDDLLADGCFQEVEPGTGEAVFSWCASDWFDVGLGYWNFSGPTRGRDRREDRNTTSTGFDVYHINSLQKMEDGNYFLSLRNLKTLTYLNGETGKPIWNLGGKINDFTDRTEYDSPPMDPDSGGALSFGWQHHARMYAHPNPERWHAYAVTIFDNHELTNDINCTGVTCSRGRLLFLYTNTPEVHLSRDFRSPHGLSSVVFGSMQSLLPPPTRHGGYFPDAFLIGWGVSPEFSEHVPGGAVARDVQYGRLDPERGLASSGFAPSYRVFKQSWQGYPTWPPEVAITKDGSLWVSWNGATEVRSWAVYGSHEANALGPQSGTWSAEENVLMEMYPLTTIKRHGFETQIERGGVLSAFVKVAALNATGHIIGTTRMLQAGRGSSVSYCLLQDTMSFTCLIKLLV